MTFNKGATFFLLGAGGDVWDLLLRQIFFSSLGLMLYFVFKVHKGHIRNNDHERKKKIDSFIMIMKDRKKYQENNRKKNSEEVSR
jgi:hypothetical protein